MRIAHVCPSGIPIRHERGGAIQRRIREVARFQAAQGDDVTVYAPGLSRRATVVNGVRYEDVPCRTRRCLREMEFVMKTARAVRSDRFEVLHFHACPEGAAVCSKFGAVNLLSYDYFVFRRGRLTPLFHVYRSALRRFALLLPVSRFCRDESVRYWEIPVSRTRVLYNGVNLEQFSPDPGMAAAGRQKNGLGCDPVILYVGRICEQKGTDVLLDSYLRLKALMPQVRLVAAGPAERFGNSASSALTERLVAAGARWLGPVPEKELRAIYNMCDVFVMPTRSGEMFGMAAVEAQACGKPVVCSDEGGLPEVISRKSGLFFPAGDSPALTDRLYWVLANADLRSRLASAARRNSSRFAWGTIVSELNEIYRGVICQKGPASGHCGMRGCLAAAAAPESLHR